MTNKEFHTQSKGIVALWVIEETCDPPFFRFLTLLGMSLTSSHAAEGVSHFSTKSLKPSEWMKLLPDCPTSASRKTDTATVSVFRWMENHGTSLRWEPQLLAISRTSKVHETSDKTFKISWKNFKRKNGHDFLSELLQICQWLSES